LRQRGSRRNKGQYCKVWRNDFRLYGSVIDQLHVFYGEYLRIDTVISVNSSGFWYSEYDSVFSLILPMPSWIEETSSSYRYLLDSVILINPEVKSQRIKIFSRLVCLPKHVVNRDRTDESGSGWQLLLFRQHLVNWAFIPGFLGRTTRARRYFLDINLKFTNTELEIGIDREKAKMLAFLRKSPNASFLSGLSALVFYSGWKQSNRRWNASSRNELWIFGGSTFDVTMESWFNWIILCVFRKVYPPQLYRYIVRKCWLGRLLAEATYRNASDDGSKLLTVDESFSQEIADLLRFRRKPTFAYCYFYWLCFIYLVLFCQFAEAQRSTDNIFTYHCTFRRLYLRCGSFDLR